MKRSQEPEDSAQDSALRTPRQTLRTLACPLNPLPRRNRRLPADIAISCPEIALGCGRDNDPVNHLADRVFAFQFVKHFIGRPSRPFVRLSQPATDARYRVQLTSYLLISGSIQQHGLG